MFWSQQTEENPLNPFTHLRHAYELLVDFLSVLWFYIQNYFWHLLFGYLILYYIYRCFLKGAISSLYQKYNRYRERKREEQYAAKYHKNPDLFSARISTQQSIAQKLQEKYYREAQEYEQKRRQKEALKNAEALRNLDKEKGPAHSLKTEQNEFAKLFEPVDNCNQDGNEAGIKLKTSSKEEYVRKLQEKYNEQMKQYEEKIKQKEIKKKQESLAKMTTEGSSSGHRLGNGSSDQKKLKSLRPEYNPLMGSGGSNYRPVKKSKCPGGGCG